MVQRNPSASELEKARQKAYDALKKGRDRVIREAKRGIREAIRDSVANSGVPDVAVDPITDEIYRREATNERAKTEAKKYIKGLCPWAVDHWHEEGINPSARMIAANFKELHSLWQGAEMPRARIKDGWKDRSWDWIEERK